MIGILTDVTKCTGCFQCVDACVEANGLGPDTPAPQDAPDGLSARRWTTVVEQPAGHYVRKQCRHCLEPACVSACPVGAMQKTPAGPVIYDGSKCMGCRYCVMACPYGIPRYEWNTAVPYVQKCTLCYERLQTGQMPACAKACPEQATIFGERDELLAEAHFRLKTFPDMYVQQVYGEYEVGGTSVLYISDVSLDFLGFNGYSGREPLPDLTQGWLDKVPPITLGMTFLMAGPYWIVKRRMRLAAEAAADSGSSTTEIEPEERTETDE